MEFFVGITKRLFLRRHGWIEIWVEITINKCRHQSKIICTIAKSQHQCQVLISDEFWTVVISEKSEEEASREITEASE